MNKKNFNKDVSFSEFIELKKGLKKIWISKYMKDPSHMSVNVVGEVNKIVSLDSDIYPTPSMKNISFLRTENLLNTKYGWTDLNDIDGLSIVHDDDEKIDEFRNEKKMIYEFLDLYYENLWINSEEEKYASKLYEIYKNMSLSKKCLKVTIREIDYQDFIEIRDFVKKNIK